MSARHALATASIILVAISANAQQQPQPLPQQTDATEAAPKGPPVFHTFPVTAARYHTWLNWILSYAQKANGKGPVTQGDVNKINLRMRDCATRVEADGYVTQSEYESCIHVFDRTMNEIILDHRLNSPQ
jgi:hypothetical protein